MEKIFQNIKQLVERELSCSAHDMEHTLRVYNLCLKLSEGEDVDLDVLKASALLHDIGRVNEDNDSTGKTDHALLSAEMAEEILNEINFPHSKIQHVKDCIISHRYRTGITPETIEAKILFDADKLDTLGAIGVARCYVWVGRNNAKIYRKMNPEEYAKENLDGTIKGRIKDKTKHSPQIEYETKIKHLVDKLHTSKAKEMGKERLNYFKNYLERLEKEIEGDF